jgi:hypothetical protein
MVRPMANSNDCLESTLGEIWRGKKEKGLGEAMVKVVADLEVCAMEAREHSVLPLLALHRHIDAVSVVRKSWSRCK